MYVFELQKKSNSIALRIPDAAKLLFPAVAKLLSLSLSRAQIFQFAYATRAWGSAESGSGIGSELAATENISAYLPELFQRLQVSKFLDAPCGDWNWMKQVDLSGVDYFGADIVSSVITKNKQEYARPGVQFIHADLTKDPLPTVDMIMCRDCWVHLSFEDIAAMLKNFRRTGARWLLVSNTPGQNRNKNKATGIDWRHLNLHLPPFNFPAEIESRKDHYPDVPFEITLWRLAELPEISL
jgi:Methyltransferase domain